MFLRGHTVFLRPPSEADVTTGEWATWYNDYDSTRFSQHGVFPVTRETELAYVREMLASRSSLLLAVCDLETGKLIGNVSLAPIDLLNRKAGINIMIGSPAHRGTSAGLEAMGLMLQHGFDRLNLHRIWAGAQAGLRRWVQMLQALGFCLEGTLREDELRNGEYVDTLAFAVLENDFRSLVERRGGRILGPDLKSLLREVANVSPLSAPHAGGVPR